MPSHLLSDSKQQVDNDANCYFRFRLTSRGQLKIYPPTLKELFRQRRKRTEVSPVKSLNSPGERQEQIIWNVLVLNCQRCEIWSHNKSIRLAFFGSPCRCLFRCYSRSKCRELFSTAHVWCLDVA